MQTRRQILRHLCPKLIAEVQYTLERQEHMVAANSVHVRGALSGVLQPGDGSFDWSVDCQSSSGRNHRFLGQNRLSPQRHSKLHSHAIEMLVFLLLNAQNTQHCLSTLKLKFRAAQQVTPKFSAFTCLSWRICFCVSSKSCGHEPNHAATKSSRRNGH